MKILNNIYKNTLGASYAIAKKEVDTTLVIEINQISFYINPQELKEFITSTQSILNYHSNCTCPPELENKMVIYKAKQTEIRMMLSYHQLQQLNDLLKGTDFKLSMDDILNKYKII